MVAVLDTSEISHYLLAPTKTAKSITLDMVLSKLGCRVERENLRDAKSIAKCVLYVMLLLAVQASEREDLEGERRRRVESLKEFVRQEMEDNRYRDQTGLNGESSETFNYCRTEQFEDENDSNVCYDQDLRSTWKNRTSENASSWSSKEDKAFGSGVEQMDNEDGGAMI